MTCVLMASLLGGGGVLMGGSNHVKGCRDSQVNYNIAEDSFFPESE